MTKSAPRQRREPAMLTPLHLAPLRQRPLAIQTPFTQPVFVCKFKFRRIVRDQMREFLESNRNTSGQQLKAAAPRLKVFVSTHFSNMFCHTISSPSLQLGHLSSLSLYLEDADIVRTFRSCRYLYEREYPKFSLTGNYSVNKVSKQKLVIPKIFNFVFDDSKQNILQYTHAKSLIVQCQFDCFVGNISQYPRLTSVSFARVRIGDVGVATLAEALKFNSTITSLGLCDNQIGDVGAAALADALKINSTVTSVRLNGNRIAHVGAAALAEALKVNSTITSIDLKWNLIGDIGAAAFAEALKLNSTITSIDLWDNEIRDVGAAALVEALKVNATITFINLVLNEIRDVGTAALAEALKINSKTMSIDF